MSLTLDRSTHVVSRSQGKWQGLSITICAGGDNIHTWLGRLYTRYDLWLVFRRLCTLTTRDIWTKFPLLRRCTLQRHVSIGGGSPVIYREQISFVPLTGRITSNNNFHPSIAVYRMSFVSCSSLSSVTRKSSGPYLVVFHFARWLCIAKISGNRPSTLWPAEVLRLICALY